jgi:hypothetical protein
MYNLYMKREKIFVSIVAGGINNITYLLQQVSTLLDVSDFVIDSLTALVRCYSLRETF